MTAFATQSNIQMTGAGLLGRSTASVGKSSRVTIGSGLTLSAGVLSCSLDLSGYLPLSGGTLTGPITGTSGLIEQRNGLTAQCYDLFETYTSSTNNGKLRLKATSSGHQIGSARATSGSNRAVQLGHFDAADAFTSALSVETSRAVSVYDIYGMEGTWAIVRSNGAFRFWTDVWASRNAAGVLQIGTSSSNASGSMLLTNLTASGYISVGTLTDAAAPNNSIYYSSTQSKLVYKNSGGTVNVLY